MFLRNPGYNLIATCYLGKSEITIDALREASKHVVDLDSYVINEDNLSVIPHYNKISFE